MTGNHNDCGYSSGHDCENWSIPSSHNGSDVACSEGMCNHDGEVYWNCFIQFLLISQESMFC